MTFDPAVARYDGPFGHAERLDYPTDRPRNAASVASWLLTAPAAHPAWSQYSLQVVSLAPFEGLPTATLKFPGATHELMLVVIDPKAGPFTEARIRAGDWPGLPFLVPVNVCEQFEATDDEMRSLAALCARGVVNGTLWPETADAPSRVREAWLGSMVRTLAHLRGEEHAP